MASKTGRPDFDAMVKISSIPANEPIFVLRAQDPAASETVRAWALIAGGLGVSPAVLEQALTHADAMDQWPTKKLPDGARLTEAQRKNLAYKFERRAWTAQGEIPDDRIVLAELRGFSRGRAAVRQLLTALKGAMLSVEWRIRMAGPDGFAGDEEEHRALSSFRDLVAAPAIARAEALDD